MILPKFLTAATISIWVLLLAVIAAQVSRTARAQGLVPALRRVLSRSYLPLFLAAVASTLIRLSLVFVAPEEVAIVISIMAREGYRDRPLRSGARWIVPLAEEAIHYPISWQTYTMAGSTTEGRKLGDDSILARTSDGQEVSIDSSVIFMIDPEDVMRLHIEWQNRYVEDFVRPTTRGLVRARVSQYTVEEVNSSKRQDLERDMDKELRAIFKSKGLILDRFILRNIAFSPEYAAAVEQKQVAIQARIESEYRAEAVRNAARGDSDATKMRAQSQADGLESISRVLAKDKNLLTYQYIDKLSPGIKVMLVPNSAPYLLPVPPMDDRPAAPPIPSGSAAPPALPAASAKPAASPALPRLVAP